MSRWFYMLYRWFLIIGIVLIILVGGESSPVQAHALPVTYRPDQNAVLPASPSNIQIKFSEHITRQSSGITVVNPSNQRVDNGDLTISSDNYTLTLGLSLLPAGTYVVAWHAHSADDGHTSAGSYIFHVARADGIVPPITGPLPTGNVVGGAGQASSIGNDTVTYITTLARWIGLLAITFLLGMIFWWRFVIPTQKHLIANIHENFNDRARLFAEYALEGLLAATIVEIIAQVFTLEGSLAGLFSWPILSNILFSSRFGWFIVLRIILCISGLFCLWIPAIRTSLTARNQNRIAQVFGLVLGIVFVYSGHGGATHQLWGSIVDYLHLLANGIWLGGLFTLTLIMLPVISNESKDALSAYLRTNISAFSVPALVAVALLVITGPLNGTARFTALNQIITTPYGIVLIIKIALFMLMGTISYYHAFKLRPHLMLIVLKEKKASNTSTHEQVKSTAKSISQWIRIESFIGVALLFCVALLSPLGATLTYVTPASASYGAEGGTQSITQEVDGLKLRLTVSPGHFGTNTFTVAVTNPDNTSATGGNVFIETQMVEMDMGINHFDLATTNTPGTYSGKGELPMAGHWILTVTVRTEQDPDHYHRATFRISASY
jgi:copper transport protein